MARWIIVKYHEYFWYYKPSAYDSTHTTYTGREINCPASFDTKEEGLPWLEKMTELNPTVDYGLVMVNDVIQLKNTSEQP